MEFGSFESLTKLGILFGELFEILYPQNLICIGVRWCPKVSVTCVEIALKIVFMPCGTVM